MTDYWKGQRAWTRLAADLRDQTLRHAYLFEGAAGIGKRTEALRFAAAIHCTGADKPCGVCPSCKKHLAHTHPDVSIVGADVKHAIRVDDVRAAISDLEIKPILSDRKICIIEHADRMNSAAQNALLKVFEEPPRYAIVILLSENAQNLLPTIRSRGMRVAFSPLSPEAAADFVRARYPAHASKAAFAAAYSGGVIGRIIELCEDEAFFARRAAMMTAAASLIGDRQSIFLVADCFGGAKASQAEIDEAFALFLSFFRDVEALKCGGKLLNADYRAEIAAFASRVTAASAVSIAEHVAKTKAELNPSMKYELWIVDMLIKCWGDLHGKHSWNTI